MIGSAYILVVVGILLAKGLGFYRDMVFAGVFGTGMESDIYFQIFGLVNLIFTGIGVALSTLVIKNLNKPENAGHERAYAAQFLRKSMAALLLAALLLAAFARVIVRIVLPEATGAQFDLALRMMYIMLPSLVFVVVAYIISGLLQNKQAYFITSIMSLPFNVILIAALFFPGVSIETVAVVTTIGWFLHIAVQLPAFYKKGYAFLAPRERTLKKTGKNTELLWIFLSNMMFQMCVYIDRAFVSGSEGMPSTFNYASNLFITISSVFAVAMSTVVFPSISKNYEEGQLDYVSELVRYIITIMAAIFLPFLLVVSFFGSDVIRLVYERGEFTAESTKAVAWMFQIYSFGLLGYVAQELFNKVLYLAGKYVYTVLGTLSVIALNVAMNFGARGAYPLPQGGGLVIGRGAFLIALGTAVLLTLYAVLVAFSLRKVIGAYWKKALLIDLLKIGFAGAAATLCYVAFQAARPDFTHGYLTFLVPLGACGVVYIVAILVTGVWKHLIKRDKKGESEQ